MADHDEQKKPDEAPPTDAPATTEAPEGAAPEDTEPPPAASSAGESEARSETPSRKNVPAKRQGFLERFGGRTLVLGAVVLVTVLATLGVTALLVSIFERKQEAREPFVRVVEVDQTTTDPAPWGLNWPHHLDQYKMTAGERFYGGSSALTTSKLKKDPWLRRLYAGYAFSIDYREARGHAYMLYDQVVTERVTKRKQAGACLHCHASTTVLYRKVGREALGLDASPKVLANSFNRNALIRGFEELSPRPYHEVLAMLAKVPDGTPEKGESVFPSPPVGGFEAEQDKKLQGVHPVSCIDCHDPGTMSIRITRPGFMLGIAALAKGDAPVPHLPSIERWRSGSRDTPYDPNEHATRQEMRSFVCGQCHVEYYCANKMTLTFPWENGLKVEDLERYWEELDFPDGTDFYDWEHGETGAKLFKAQHPEFELWSQGVHARAGVSCADCHMPYERRGALKMSSHDVRSPLLSLNNSCQNCHRSSERELLARIESIQGRTVELMDRTAQAMTDMLDAIREAQAAGASAEQLASLFDLQRKAMWRLDYISSENSRGFHAAQEAARILGESIDFSRQAQAAALRLRAPEAPDTSELPSEPVQGVTEGNPPGPDRVPDAFPPNPGDASAPDAAVAPDASPKPGASALPKQEAPAR